MVRKNEHRETAELYLDPKRGHVRDTVMFAVVELLMSIDDQLMQLTSPTKITFAHTLPEDVQPRGE